MPLLSPVPLHLLVIIGLLVQHLQRYGKLGDLLSDSLFMLLEHSPALTDRLLPAVAQLGEMLHLPTAAQSD